MSSAKRYPGNPFALLRISTEATPQEVVNRSKELIEDTDDKDLMLAYSKAVQQIIHKPSDHLEQAAWEMPDTDYEEHDETWQNFAGKFRLNPITLNSLQQFADMFVEENFHPDRLLELLSPLLKVSRPTEKCTFALAPPVTEDLHYPLSSKELF